jgi:Leucine-rich repeat (LRR) protein
LEHIKGLTQLRTLDLSRTEVTDAGLEHLKGLVHLESLDVGDSKVEGAGLEELSKALPNLHIRAMMVPAIPKAK